jgi:hypothetical protein
MKDSNIGSKSVMTQVIKSNAAMNVANNNTNGLQNLSNSRFIGNNMVLEGRSLQTIGAVSQARYITSEWKGDASRIFDLKHSSHSIT